MPIEPTAAKYATIADALQTRIDSGDYPIGALLPSETQLLREFGASRSTVVRALEHLRQIGYIEGIQGKGRVVLGRPATAPQAPGRVRAALHTAEAPSATLVGAGRAPASAHIAATLAIPIGEPVIARQRLMPASDGHPPILNTLYLPATAATGTAFHRADLLREGALDHLERRRHFAAVDVFERLSARPASTRETTLLALDRKSLVLTSLLVVHSATGRPVLVVDVATPLPPQGVEDIFKLR